MTPNRVFFPQASLDRWISEGRVDLVGSELLLHGSQRRYRVIEGVHVLREVTGNVDTYDLIGRVKSQSYLVELGAEMLDTSLLLGDNAYEVIPGFLGIPLSVASPTGPDTAQSDGSTRGMTEEQLLRRSLLEEVEQAG